MNRPSDRAARTAPRGGFTLVELLVASFLFLLLSLLLFRVVSGALHTWESARGEALLIADARRVFSCLAEDLSAVFASEHPQDGEIFFVLDRDESGEQRLRFVRSLPPESQFPLLREAGKAPGVSGYEEYYHFAHPPGKLRAPGGLAEVVYALLPGERGCDLWRGVRTPPGGDGSFFSPSNLEAGKIPEKCYRVVSGILHWKIECWTERTKAWDNPAAGPSIVWDSTCQVLPDFYLFGKRRPDKSVFPARMRISFALSGRHTEGVELNADIDAGRTEIPLRNAHKVYSPAPGEVRLLRVENEWLSYGACDSGTLSSVTRGVLGSKAAGHKAATPIRPGRFFSRVIDLPVHRVPWK